LSRDHGTTLQRLEKFLKHCSSDWDCYADDPEPTPLYSPEPKAERRYQEVYLRIRRSGTYFIAPGQESESIAHWKPSSNCSNDEYCDALMWRAYERMTRSTVCAIIGERLPSKSFELTSGSSEDVARLCFALCAPVALLVRSQSEPCFPEHHSWNQVRVGPLSVFSIRRSEKRWAERPRSH
jgi:hypothetical protein